MQATPVNERPSSVQKTTSVQNNVHVNPLVVSRLRRLCAVPGESVDLSLEARGELLVAASLMEADGLLQARDAFGDDRAIAGTLALAICCGVPCEQVSGDKHVRPLVSRGDHRDHRDVYHILKEAS